MPSDTAFRVSKRAVLECAALAIFVSASWAAADEPSRLGRLFRFGSGSSKPVNPSRTSQPILEPIAPSAPLQVPIPVGDSTQPILEPIAPLTREPQRVHPRSRASRAITEADPLITRITLGRSTDGRQFGMFLQVFEDGTIVDGEGVHALGPDAVRPIAESLATSEIFRLKGHCGSPSADFIEHIQMIVYDRRFGNLRAHSLSFSGGGEGCDHALKHLQVLLDGLQTKLSDPKREGPHLEATAAPASTEPPLPLIIGPN